MKNKEPEDALTIPSSVLIHGMQLSEIHKEGAKHDKRSSWVFVFKKVGPRGGGGNYIYIYIYIRMAFSRFRINPDYVGQGTMVTCLLVFQCIPTIDLPVICFWLACVPCCSACVPCCSVCVLFVCVLTCSICVQLLIGSCSVLSVCVPRGLIDTMGLRGVAR